MSEHPPHPVDHERLLREALARPKAGGLGAEVPGVESLAPRFPELRIEGLLGAGGMAAVYRAVQTRLERAVALKVLRPELAVQPEFGERFLREARALASLNHPHVLGIFDFGERDGCYFLLMELVDGANLRELMALGRLSPPEVLRIVPQICAGLQYAHEHGVVHRDIKPENILIDRQGQVKIADFGLAKLLHRDGDAALTRASMVFGTPNYMAPEQWRGSGTVDHRADIYSLGVVFYELLTGKLPVGSYEPPSKCTPVPGGIDAVVQRSIEQEPDRRYQSALEVQQDLERQSRPGAGASPAAPPLLQLVPLAALAILLLSALGLASLFGLDADNRQRVRFVGERRTRDVELVEAIRQSVESGRAWTGDVPENPSWYRTETLDLRYAIPGAATWCIGTLLLVTLAGIWSTRSIRNSGGALRGLFAAELAAWAPLLVLFDAGVLPFLVATAIADDDLAQMIGLTLLLAADVGLVVWLWRRSKKPFAAQPARRGLLLGAAAAGLLALAGMSAASLTPRLPGPKMLQVLPRQASDLHGLTRKQVLALLGPPLAIKTTPSAMVWAYHGLDAKVVTDAITIAGDRVVDWATNRERLVPRRFPPRGPWLGRLLTELVAEVGQPKSTINGTGSQTVEFGDGASVVVVGGVICELAR